MPKPKSKRMDVNQMAADILAYAIGEPPKMAQASAKRRVVAKKAKGSKAVDKKERR